MIARLDFVSWAPYCSRSDSIAQRLGGRSWMVYSSMWGSRSSTIAFKYLSQALRTLWLLLKVRPSVVYVMTPPVIACFPVWLYCRLFGAKFVIDAHTAAFLMPRWKRILLLHRFVSRRAAATVVTNQHLKGIVESWGARAIVVRDVPVCFPDPQPFESAAGSMMTIVSSFAYDEPIEEFLEAAAGVPEVCFYVTGNYRKLAPEVLEKKPENVQFTGFLPDSKYVGLLEASDAVIALTTRDHTMQRGAYEAVYLGRPVVTSDFEVLRDAFPKGTVHVDNTPEGIARGILEMKANLKRYETEALELRDEKWAQWNATAKLLKSELSPRDAA